MKAIEGVALVQGDELVSISVVGDVKRHGQVDGEVLLGKSFDPGNDTDG